LPGLNEGQVAALRELNDSLSAQSQTLAAARTALSQATFAASPDPANIKTKAEAVAAAELGLAQARSEGFPKKQASTNKLSDRQVEALVQQGASGGGRGMGMGGGPGGPGGAPPGMSARGEEMRKWRLSQSMDKFQELRKMYNDAGVKIELVKFGL